MKNENGFRNTRPNESELVPGLKVGDAVAVHFNHHREDRLYTGTLERIEVYECTQTAFRETFRVELDEASSRRESRLRISVELYADQTFGQNIATITKVEPAQALQPTLGGWETV